ncbi:MAG TPA: glycosyltransferase family 4 protein [Candidatus Saccharimonadales bacterium]|nr:glycosyltransferase family 4 protein [Candidatus Saccharimonadales bacterium]
MKIGLVCPYHLGRPGGVLDHVNELYKELTKRGHTVKILTPMPRDFEGPVPPQFITLGTSMNTTAFAGTAWQMSFTVDNDAIDEVFNREKFDVLHFHEPYIPMWGRQLLARANCGTVGTMHGRFYDTLTAKTVKPFVTTYIKPILKYIDVFTAVSTASIDHFNDISDREVTIIPNGIDIDKFKPVKKVAKPKDRMRTVLYVGRLEDRKGVKYLIRAYAKMAEKRSDVQLIIAGAGGSEKKLKQMVTDEAVPRVMFDSRYISEQEKIDYLHSADVFCSAAPYGEAFGIVLLEAMAAGIPIVAGDNAGYTSTMQGTGALSLVNPKDTVDFARRLEVFLFEDDIRNLWCKWAGKYINKFTFPIIVGQYEEVYKQAIATYAKRKKTKSRLSIRRYFR